MEKTHLTTQKELTKQKGFTLIELALVLIVMAIITSFTTKAYLFQKAFEREEARADKTIQEIIQISEAMGGWRLDKGDWAGWVGAGAANNCVSAIDILTNPPSTPATPANPNPTAYLRYVDVVSPYDTDYITSCDSNNFTIEVKSNKDYAPYIRTHLANTIVNPAPDDDTTITSIPRNTINPTLADFLPFAGTTNRQMLGDINMGDNAISNASDIEALNIELNGQDIKLGIGKFVSMGSKAFDTCNTCSSSTAMINKPNCNQGAIIGTPKIILRLHGFETEQGSVNGIRDVRWSAKFISINTTQWQLRTTGLDAITGVAETFCDYGGWNR
jgi:prepilin-type N-terminal cleavage/methylation domain-containing protein